MTEVNERAGEREKESSQYVLQFIWSFIRVSETERGRRGAEQKQSRDFQEKRCVAKINKNSFTPSLRPALSRHTIRAKHTHAHRARASLHLLPRKKATKYGPRLLIKEKQTHTIKWKRKYGA